MSVAGSLKTLACLCVLFLPASLFVAVEYEGGRYSIGRTDLASKRIFGVLMLLAAVMERPGPSPQPVITIPAG
jgi:hypothetical protein